MAKKGGLGKGLDALFSESSSAGDGVITLPIGDVVPNKEQPRKDFSEEALADLSDSVKKYGILQPIIVKPMPDTTYKIIAGERRYRAAMMAGLTEIPVIVKEISEKEVSEIALIENLQREDLNPVEEALGYKNLQETYSLTQEEIAETLGKSRSAVANSLRLLTLPEEVIVMLKNGELTGGHARALLSLNDKDIIITAAKKIADTGASVREAERLAKAGRKPGKPAVKPVANYLKEMELALTETTGKKISITGSKKHGKLTIEFFSEEELREIAGKISGENI